jgi:hypothetical protein
MLVSAFISRARSKGRNPCQGGNQKNYKQTTTNRQGTGEGQKKHACVRCKSTLFAPMHAQRASVILSAPLTAPHSAVVELEDGLPLVVVR